MGERTSIGWTHHTFNPWWGCARVSPGCENCYAETFSARVGHGKSLPQIWGVDAARRPMSDEYWRQPLKWNRAAEKAGERRRVFCASMADVFEILPERNVDGFRVQALARARLWGLITDTPWLDWLLLTKRPENVRVLAPWSTDRAPRTFTSWPPNVWLGVTAEDQRRADERIPILLDIPAAVRFVSHEPALEEIRLPDVGIDWVITGGESGPGARPYDVRWARRLIEHGSSLGVAVFVKQLGACASDAQNGLAGASLKVPPEALALVSRRLKAPKGDDPAEWPDELRVQEFPS